MDPKEIKAQIFDILVELEKLNNQAAKMNKKKDELLKKLDEALKDNKDGD